MLNHWVWQGGREEGRRSECEQNEVKEWHSVREEMDGETEREYKQTEIFKYWGQRTVIEWKERAEVFLSPAQ